MHNLDPTLQAKFVKLEDLFREWESVVVAFSGGVDSTLVLQVAVKVLKDKAVAVTAVSSTLPAAELEGVKQLGREIGVSITLIETDQLQDEQFVKNDGTRCFHCKTDLYRLLDDVKIREGCHVMVDGTNVDDLGEDRPGIQAAKQWGVRSPLFEAGLTKAEIRQLAKTLGLSNWDKPAAACLSSRITRGIPITRTFLSRVEQAEAVLAGEGLNQVRVRLHGDLARIEVDPSDMPFLVDESRRQRIATELKAIGFQIVTLDLEGYRPGGGNVEARQNKKLMNIQTNKGV